MKVILFIFILSFTYSFSVHASESKGENGVQTTQHSPHPPHDHQDHDHLKYLKGHGNERRRRKDTALSH